MAIFQSRTVDFAVDEQNYDLTLDENSFDFKEGESEMESVRAMLKEAFDMQPADDIDDPEFYSKQRIHDKNDSDTADQERLNDAYRILAQFPQINQKSIRIQSLPEGLSIYFRLHSGEEAIVSL